MAFALLLGMPAFATHPAPTPDPTPVSTQEQGQGQLQGQGQESTNVVETVVAPTVISENQVNSTIVDESRTVLANGQQQGQTSENSNTNGQQQSADSSAAQSQNASNNGVTTTVSSVYKQVRQVASAHADAGNATIYCAKDRRAGIQLPGIGLSAGGTATDRDCALLRAAETELSIGNVYASVKLRCATKLYRALGDDCEALLNTQTGAKDTASKEYVDRAVKKALAK